MVDWLWESLKYILVSLVELLRWTFRVEVETSSITITLFCLVCGTEVGPRISI